MTPLFIVLLVVESTDLLFAIDSIPAIFAVTRDPFLVFTSNVFAILGLRSLYFALAGLMDRFRYLKMSLVFILAFVGVKMILSHHHPVPTAASLAFIGGILIVGVLASILAARRDSARLARPLTGGREEQLADEAVAPEPFADVALKQLRRVVIILLGSTVLLVGLALLVLPGPGTLVMAAGLAILGAEFLWARKLFGRMKDVGLKIANSLGMGSETGASDDEPTKK
jgi:tellurite resistance protein TerC